MALVSILFIIVRTTMIPPFIMKSSTVIHALLKELIVLIIVLTACSLQVSCKQKEKTVSLPDCENMMETFWDGGDHLLHPTRMFLGANGNRLVIYQMGAVRPFLSYDIHNLTLGQCAGFAGRGPAELTRADIRSFRGTETGFSVFDAGGENKYYSISYDGTSLQLDSAVTTGLGAVAQNGMLPLDRGILNINTDGSGKEFVLSAGDGSARAFSPYPDWTDDTGENPMTLYLKQLTIHPDGSSFVACYAFFPRLRFFASDGNLQKDILVDIPLNEEAHPLFRKKVYYGTYPCSDERYIVTLYGKMEFQIFDWKGNLLKRKRSSLPIDTFTVDFSRGILYAYSSSREKELIQVRDFLP